MKAAMFSTHHFDKASFDLANKALDHQIDFISHRLDPSSALLAKSCAAVIASVDDQLDATTLTLLSAGGTRLIALRCKGFNNIDLEVARGLGLRVVRVPDYSPHCVAEHVFALVLALLRHIPESQRRTRDENFTIEGLVGAELYGKTFGIVGTGKIGLAVARIAHGFGCKVVAFDIQPPTKANELAHINYLPLGDVVQSADILSLHAPLTPATHHVINAQRLASMQPGAFLINTARGGLVDTLALIAALKANKIGGAGLDVYEQESSVFDHDLSLKILSDDVLARLLTFNNVVLTSHMAFLTKEALKDIADTTLSSLSAFERHENLKNEIMPKGSEPAKAGQAQ